MPRLPMPDVPGAGYGGRIKPTRLPLTFRSQRSFAGFAFDTLFILIGWGSREDAIHAPLRPNLDERSPFAAQEHGSRPANEVQYDHDQGDHEKDMDQPPCDVGEEPDAPEYD
jgi:hypothetical protein